MKRAAVVAALVVAGCVQAPGERPDLARASVAPAPAPAPIADEVAIAGSVVAPKGDKGDVTVWITDGPCWQPGTRALSSTRAGADGAFLVDVFAAQGTQLWICAALGDPSQPMAWSGQARQAPALGRGLGRVAFTNLKIPLTKGEPVRAPRAK